MILYDLSQAARLCDADRGGHGVRARAPDRYRPARRRAAQEKKSRTVVSVIYYMAQKQKLSTDKLTEIENKARNHAIRRVLKVSTAIVRKLNPNCGFVLIDKLEQMDTETLQGFGTWLEQEGLQAIATRVSTGGECSIIIEDGTWEKAYAGNPRTAGVAG